MRAILLPAIRPPNSAKRATAERIADMGEVGHRAGTYWPTLCGAIWPTMPHTTWLTVLAHYRANSDTWWWDGHRTTDSGSAWAGCAGRQLDPESADGAA